MCRRVQATSASRIETSPDGLSCRQEKGVPGNRSRRASLPRGRARLSPTRSEEKRGRVKGPAKRAGSDLVGALKKPIVPPNEEADEARREEERQARAALAEYFSILREWSLNSRSDDVLAPDDTEEP